MHPTAAELGAFVFNTHWKPHFRRILDIGSMNVNGSLRESAPSHASYTGIDLEAGPGVDTVLEDPYKYPYPDNYFDFIVSTSCFEHDPMFWLTFMESARVLNDGGILYINAPSNGSYHTHPWDNWRFYPDASHALQMWAQRNHVPILAIESFTMTKCEPWNDYVMVFSKGEAHAGVSAYMSDAIPNVTNIRKKDFPGQVFNLDHDSPDMREIARLNGLVSRLQAENEDLRRDAKTTTG